MKIDERTGEVVRRPTLEKNKITRRHRVVNKRVERTKKIDSRFDTRRSPFKWKKLHPRNIGVVYLYALIWIVFSLWIPDTWTMWLTHRSVLNQNAILMVVAIGLLVPLAAGVFDLSIGATISASAVTAGWGMVEADWSVPVAIMAALLVGVLVGFVNGLLVVKVKIDSFIATLAMSSVLTAYSVWRSNNRSILGFPDSFKNLATEFVWGVNKTVVVALVIAFVFWYVFEHTAAGRYLFATGGAREAARLAGVQTDRYVWGSLMVSSTFAALGGVLLAAQFGSTQAQSGAPYLLPAFAAAFLGSTQFKRRFNVWGTMLAVVVLQSGVKGLQLAGVGTTWIESLFFGVALAVAVGFSTFRKRVHGGQRRWWRREESGPDYFLGRILRWGVPRTEQSKQNAEQWWFDPEDKEGHHLKP
ncbi:MAG: ABC transporter permease [Ilumatobacteraceae bacterium]